VSAVSDFSYVGSELELFAHVTNWKAYFASRIRPHLGDEVLEVGAGLGATAQVLCTRPHQRWVCLEPDANLVASLETARTEHRLPACCQARVGTLAGLESDDRFDSILYIDVLEHIADDRAELEAAARHLRPQGRLIVLAPAHQWLFTPFDKAIGHYRRYNKKMLAAIAPEGLRTTRLIYLDSVGMLASMGNRFLLGSGMPSRRQLWVWDKLMVPISRLLDPLLCYSIGKSVLGIWSQEGSQGSDVRNAGDES
jgi:ubiquinone/menaquinone biosynthesis C-methylase UbiE